MSKIAFDFGKYRVIVSNHGWYEIHNLELRKKIIESDIKHDKIMGKTDAGGLIIKQELVDDSLLYSGKVMTGFVDGEHDLNIKDFARKRLFWYLTKKKAKK